MLVYLVRSSTNRFRILLCLICVKGSQSFSSNQQCNQGIQYVENKCTYKETYGIVTQLSLTIGFICKIGAPNNCVQYYITTSQSDLLLGLGFVNQQMWQSHFIPYVSSEVGLFSTYSFVLASYPSTWGSGNKRTPTLPSDCIPWCKQKLLFATSCLAVLTLAQKYRVRQHELTFDPSNGWAETLGSFCARYA
jgi:hypothetical protein